MSLTHLMTSDISASPPLLSLCIPTYNRCATLVPLVRRVLSMPGDEIQVVVLDNGSTDDTLARLAEIGDPRLIVRSNGVNRGVLFNVVNVLVQGTASYSILLLDKDSLDPALIPDFLEFLRHERPECGYSKYGLPVGTPPRSFPAGEAALRAVAYSCHHPTGYFFRTESLRRIEAAKRFTDFDFVGHFPFEFMQAELCLLGKGAIYQAPAFSPEVLQLSKSTKSHGTDASKEDAFFSPKGRLKTAVNFSKHIMTLPIPAALAKQLVLDRFAQGLRQSTLGYRYVLGNESICEHYHIEARTLGWLKMLRIAWWFFLQFSQQLIERDARRTKLSRAVLLADTFQRLQRAVARRLSRILA